MTYLADCPRCGKKASVALGSGSLENLKTGKGDVVLAHPTDDPKVGDHTWVLQDSSARARLKSLVLAETSRPSVRQSGRRAKR